MMTDLFWDVATSTAVMSGLGLLLLGALVVGYFPLLKYLPAIGSYVPTARLVAALVAALLFFLIGYRLADEREQLRGLKFELLVKQADLDEAKNSAADATKRATQIEAAADEKRQSDADYIASLKPSPDCGFEPFPGRLREPAELQGRRARSAAKSGAAVQGPASSGARHAMSLPLVWFRWLQGKGPERDVAPDGER